MLTLRRVPAAGSPSASARHDRRRCCLPGRCRVRPADPRVRGAGARQLRAPGRDGAHRRGALTRSRPGYCAHLARRRGPEIAQQHGYVHAGIVSDDRRHRGRLCGVHAVSRGQLGADRRVQAQPAGARAGERLVAEGFVVKPGRTLCDHARRGACGARRHAHPGGAHAADADGDARQGRRLTSCAASHRVTSRTCHAQLPLPVVPPRRDDRHAARDRAAVRGRRDRAARRGHRPHQPVPARPVAQDGRPGPARHHRRGRVRRHRHGLPRALRRDGGDLARVGLRRAFLRRAFQPLREPDPPQRHAGAEGASTCRSSSAASTSARWR